jgi:microsomal prostaglandin-E synthase 2
VDTHLVKTFSPNIYRTLSESVRSFKHITTVGNFSAFGRTFGQYIGGVTMYVLGKRLKKK